MTLNKNTRILIVGLGLMGGSYAKALTRRGYRVSAITKEQSSVDYALREGIIAYGTTAIEPEPVIPWRIAGEVLDTYIVCEDAEKTVWLIDKHAAHERVNFDRFKANLEPIMSQELLTPVVAQFAAAEYTALVGQLALLREFGFACEEFGDGAILIRALPADIPAEDAAASLEDLAGRLVETHHADPESARDALLHTMACKAAIKGGWKSDERELRVLVDKVQSGEVRFCPHGRPVAVKLTKYELEKMFKRA